MSVPKKENSVILRSEYDHDHSIKVKSSSVHIAPDGVFVPAGTVVVAGKQHRGKNITIIPNEVWEEIKDSFFIKEGLNGGMLMLLKEVPNTYFGALEQVSLARNEALEAKKKAKDIEAELSKKDAVIEELKSRLANAGL
jgi:hypothetical protein